MSAPFVSQVGTPTLTAARIDHLPIIAHYLRRLGLVKIINALVPVEMAVEPGLIVLGLILDTLSGRSPLYHLEKTFEDYDQQVLFGQVLAPGYLGLIPDTFNLSGTWDNTDPANPGIKQKLDDILSSLPGSLSIDGLIDNSNFKDSVAVVAFNRVLDKHRNGVQGFARAALSAIGRAEDLVWLQTPALDSEKFVHDDGDIHFLTALINRLEANPALRCLIIVPEEHLPDRNNKLNTVRKSAIGAALQVLEKTAPDRVAWVAPIAGPGRVYHMASTTLIVDDVVMLTGAAHAWRRGLVFDSALSTAVFDEVLDAGRPQVVATARRILAGNLLSIHPQFVPITAPDMITAAKALNTGGGFNRVNPVAHKLVTDTTSIAEKMIWNPALSADTDWTATLAGLVGDIKTEFENGTR